ncbi:RNA polymerase sigma-70 factor (ECF subfamily) [Mariniflexile fucanivorans]|uniref:RNA polymerase sigma factor n=1 Tax=Mariniflexile fucanivorans TaxID=264023 RepID=A0A4R1RKN6_9FLAO|nr:RNA polymerase sigma factor [Mariniflexile fucanivorans]TCL66626.1 RNA polymerase sigma-70 factor (ECF subfamily) [Mariniflexile fucanivorans]
MTDEELISGIIDENQLYFKIFVDKYQSLVLNTCFHFTHNKNDAEDITQEVFIKAYQTIEKFTFQSKISTWLYRIAVNKSLNFIRDNKKRTIFKSLESFFSSNVKYNPPTEDTLAEDAYDDIKTQRLISLRNAINLLPENQKTAFILHNYESISYKEIATIMDVSIASVEGLIHRAKLNIQKNILKKIKKSKSL